MSGFMSPDQAGAFAAAHNLEIAQNRREIAEYDQMRRDEEERRERRETAPPPLRCIGHCEIKIRGVWHHNGTHWLPNDPALHYAIGGDKLADRVPHIFQLRERGAFVDVPKLNRSYSVGGCGWVPTVPTMVHASQFPGQHTGVMLSGTEMAIMFDWLDDMADGTRKPKDWAQRALGGITDSQWGDEDALAQERIEDARCVFFFTE